ncbi:hypothetical protein U1Q18_027438 [Sarracenia purpurea var. burkii]
MAVEIILSVILLIVGIAVLVTIHFCIVGRVFRMGDHNNDGGNSLVVQRRNSEGASMSQDEIIRKLPCFEYTNSSTNPPMECAVCLESFKVGEMCRLLPNCSHSFHARCIDSWLSKTALCPICRTRARSPRKFGEQSSNPSEVGVELA